MSFRIALCLLLPLLLSLNAGAEAELKGRVVRNTVNGPPMAMIAVSAEGANPTHTDPFGVFRLKFTDKEPGAPVEVLLGEDRWVIVNRREMQRELPRDPDQRMVLVVISTPAEQYSFAQAYYLRDIAKNSGSSPANPGAVLNQAQELAQELALANGRPALTDRAIRAFLSGQTDEALRLLARDRQTSGQTQAARQQRIEALRTSGKVLAISSRFDEAERAYRAAVDIGPKYFAARFDLASFYYDMRRYQQGAAGVHCGA